MLCIYEVNKSVEIASAVGVVFKHARILKDSDKGFTYFFFDYILSILLGKIVKVTEGKEPLLVLLYTLGRSKIPPESITSFISAISDLSLAGRTASPITSISPMFSFFML